MNRQLRMHTDVVIEATPSEVWAVLHDVGRWPEWNPCVSSAHPPVSLGDGVAFEAKQGFLSIRFECTSMEVDHRLAWRCRSLVRSSLVVCSLYDNGDKTTVTFDELVETWTLLWRAGAERADFEKRAELFEVEVSERSRR